LTVSKRPKNPAPAARSFPWLPLIVGAIVITIAGWFGFRAGATPSGAAPVAWSPDIHHAEGVRYLADTRTYTLAPGRAMEFMYQLNTRATMVYGWTATGEVEYDLHNEPDGDPNRSQSIQKGVSTEGHGGYTAPFDGLHGWYWRNTTPKTVTVELTASGFFRTGKIFYENGTSEAVNIR
jgi:hypothetical protein